MAFEAHPLAGPAAGPAAARCGSGFRAAGSRITLPGVLCPAWQETPDVVELPGMAGARDALRKLMEQARATPHAEVEVRFGTWDGRSFTAGVPPAVYDRLHAFLRTEGGLPETEPRETHDIFVRAPPPGAQKVRIRTKYDEQRLVTEMECCVKTRLHDVLFRTSRADGLAFKVSLSEEVPFPAERLEPVAVSYHFRIRQTRQLLYGSGTAEGRPADWSYDLALTWEGRDLEEAEAAQLRGQARCELEIELVGEYVQRHGDAHVADSLLCKALDLARLEQGDVTVDMIAR